MTRRNRGSCLGCPAAFQILIAFIHFSNLDSWIVWLLASFSHSFTHSHSCSSRLFSFRCCSFHLRLISVAYRRCHQNLDPKATWPNQFSWLNSLFTLTVFNRCCRRTQMLFNAKQINSEKLVTAIQMALLVITKMNIFIFSQHVIGGIFILI